MSQRVGPYELVAELGRGERQAIYLVRRPGLVRETALRVLSARAGPEEREAFRRAARLASELQHPAVLGCFDLGEDPATGLLYAAYEHVAGTPLRARLAEGPLPADEVLELGVRLADALAYAHERGVVHGRLSADCVVLDRAGHPRVVGFGDASPDAADAAAQAGDLRALADLLLAALGSAAEGDARREELRSLCARARATGTPGGPRADAAAFLAALRGLRREALGTYSLVSLETSDSGEAANASPDRLPALALVVAAACAGGLVALLLLLALGGGAPSAPVGGGSAASAGEGGEPPASPAEPAPRVSTGPAAGAGPAPGSGAASSLGPGSGPGRPSSSAGGGGPGSPEAPTPAVGPAAAPTVDPALDPAQGGAPAPTEGDRRAVEALLERARELASEWDFGAAEGKLASAAEAGVDASRLGVVRRELDRARADEARVLGETVAIYRDALRPGEALAAVEAALREHPGSLELRRLRVHLLAEFGRFEEALAVLEEVAARSPVGPSRQDAQRLRYLRAMSAGGLGPSDPAVWKEWSPHLGGHWRLEEGGVLRGRLVGLGPYGFAGLAHRGAGRLAPPYRLSVEIELDCTQQTAFGGLFFALERPGDGFLVYVYHCPEDLPPGDEGVSPQSLREREGAWPKGLRYARLRDGGWELLQQERVRFPDTGWTRLEVEVEEGGFRATVQGVPAAPFATAAPLSGRVGVLKFYADVVGFRRFAWEAGR